MDKRFGKIFTDIPILLFSTLILFPTKDDISPIEIPLSHNDLNLNLK